MLQRRLSLAPQDLLKVLALSNVAHNNVAHKDAPTMVLNNMAHSNVAHKDAPIMVLNNVALNNVALNNVVHKVERLGKVSLSQLMVNRERELVLLLRINERKLLV